MRHESSCVHPAQRDEVDDARIIIAHSAHELDLEASTPRRKRAAIRNAGKNDATSDPQGAHSGITESPPISVFGTTPIG